jgi:glycosyltransferase involved in cell wall biosynthesis
MYIDSSFNEGGVRLCTEEYIKVLSENFDLIIFPIENRKSLLYKVQVRLGLNKYRDFKYSNYTVEILRLIENHNIDYVFLNQCNTAKFVFELKYFKGHLKVFICSHGNESGDLLHELTRFHETQPIYRRIFANWVLGKTLRTEVFQRLNFIDGVLTVSEVENQIENWLGAKKVLFIPRTIHYQPISYNETLGVVGFIGDLSHPPNYFGLKSVFEALNRIEKNDNFQFRLVGSGTSWGEKLANEFPFVSYLGYLSNEELTNECASWSFFLNPVFYYSRGVSTKLAKALGMGIPVISTSIGKRGYEWQEGQIPSVVNPDDMAREIMNLAFDKEAILHYRNEVKLIAKSAPNMEQLGNKLSEFIAS